jgi:hypothetical protein
MSAHAGKKAGNIVAINQSRAAWAKMQNFETGRGGKEKAPMGEWE